MLPNMLVLHDEREHDVPLKYEALFREDFIMIMVTPSGLLATCRFYQD